LQKIFGARDDRAVRVGTVANAVGLLAFAFVPPVLGIISRSLHPSLADTQLALPTLLAHDVPLAIGALGLAALFSAEVSASDAILFMLATSLSQDLYARFLNRNASDSQVLRVARVAAMAGGAFGVGLALLIQTIVGALSFFYGVIGVCFFVPIVAGLYVKRVGRREALAAVIGGMILLLAVQLTTNGAGIWWLTPAMAGLLTSVVVACVAIVLFRARTTNTPEGTNA